MFDSFLYVAVLRGLQLCLGQSAAFTVCKIGWQGKRVAGERQGRR